jgi:hypothetical protein
MKNPVSMLIFLLNLVDFSADLVLYWTTVEGFVFRPGTGFPQWELWPAFLK